MTFTIDEVDGIGSADIIRHLNAKMALSVFPELEDRHLRDGDWWLAHASNGDVVGFAGLVPMTPFREAAYMKRGYVVPTARGHGIQLKFMQIREDKARRKGLTTLVGECAADNEYSIRNFVRAGFKRCQPEQPWCRMSSAYFVKYL